VTLDAGGTLAIATVGEGGMWVIDLADPTMPARVGSLDTDGDAAGVALQGTRAYVADGLGGLAVVDVAIPSSPRLLGSSPGMLARDVAVDGDFAYVGGLTGVLFVVDVRAPAAPTVVATKRLSGAAIAVGLAEAHVAVVTAAPSGDLLDVVDVTVPASPVVRATVALGSRATARDVVVSGRRAHVASTESGLMTFDLSVPSQPVLRSTIAAVGQAFGTAVDGSLAFVADFPATVSVVAP
jgi:hypothetical protein